MSIEEIEKVAELIKGLGDSAAGGFEAWIWLQVFETVWPPLISFAVIAAVYKLIAPMAQGAVTEGKATRAMMDLRRDLDIGLPGLLVQSEIDEILFRVRELHADSKAKS